MVFLGHKSNHSFCSNPPMSFYHSPDLLDHLLVGPPGAWPPLSNAILVHPPLCSPTPYTGLSVSQKPQGCPYLWSLHWPFPMPGRLIVPCIFMRLPPSYQAGLRLNVTFSKRPFLMPSLKKLPNCPHHTILSDFLHSTHHNLMLVYLVIWPILY